MIQDGEHCQGDRDVNRCFWFGPRRRCTNASQESLWYTRSTLSRSVVAEHSIYPAWIDSARLNPSSYDTSVSTWLFSSFLARKSDFVPTKRRGTLGRK